MEVEIDSETLVASKDKVVFITGASSGLGLSAARQFLQLGSRVIIADLRPPVDPVEGAVYISCDVTEWSTLVSAIRETVRLYGSIDIVVANAGIGELEDIFHDEIDETTGDLKQPKHSVIDVNLKGVLDTVKVAVHHMKKQSTGGAIIMVASSAGYLGEKMIPAYTAAKHGVVGIMRSMRANSERFNITVNVVAPWMAESGLLTDHHRRILEENRVEVTQAEMVGKAMAYLACGGLNGKALFVARNTFTELEEGISELEPNWLGEKNSAAWRATNRSSFFRNQSGL
ncbi:hypothetical protein EDB80DRAFT_308670 [Ilyonectria destructans]|nr:hypothetical protein EDB80DRAFT_308670 [Ilyonectria destructans]